MKEASTTVTQLIKAAGQGNSRASAELLPLVYGELRSLARARMRKTPPGQTLQPTALVHEAYLRLVGDADPGWSNRSHFFASAAQAMRQILVDHARAKAALKRGGNKQHIDIHAVDPSFEIQEEEIIPVHEALSELEEVDERKATLVKLHYFAGLTLAETAQIMGVSLSTVEREWRFTRALLRTRLKKKA